MRKKALYLAAGLVLVAVCLIFRGTASQQVTPAPPSVTLLLTLGQKAAKVESWDGTARVSGGSLESTEGRHFSAGDAVTAPGAWKCATRRDEVAPYADIHYTEMRPGDAPEIRFHPVGVFLTIHPNQATRVAVETAQGNFDFALDDIKDSPTAVLDGRASVVRVGSAEKLSTAEYEDDEPAITALPNGTIAAAWVAYKDRADRVFLRTRTSNAWSAPEEVTPKATDVFRCAVASDKEGNLWVFWSERQNDRWQIWGRQKKGKSWQRAERLASEGSNTFLRAAASPDGQIFLVWQSYRDGQSDIYLRALAQGAWSGEIRVSESPANDWEPAVAAGPDGAAYIAWDTYDKGNYDVQFRSYQNGKLSALQPLTSSPKFQAHATIAVDGRGQPWVGWDESGVNWAKDQGFLIPVPLATPIHQQRAVRLATWDGTGWLELRQKPSDAFPEDMRQNAEHPQIAFDANNTLTMVFRHWTRRNDRTIGSPLTWENFVTRFDGVKWTEPTPLPASVGSIEKNPALTRDPAGDVWAAWMTDARSFANMVPKNADVYCARLGKGGPAAFTLTSFQLFTEPFVEAIPVHNNDAADVRAIRAFAITNEGKKYKIYRGDMHRHTDVSQDFKYDGSLLEGYRYGLDAASFDYIALTDHQTGYDHEFTWWQNQKLVDLFLIAGSFTPLYGSERSLNFPNGHRNTIFAHRGVRTLPIPPEEASAKVGAAKLYQYLKKNNGISMPHSSATNQGTDWRDNDPEVEPLVEIYQGYRNSYEYEGAPKSATALNPSAQKSGWQPQGFWWNALAKGYKLGVQSSSDHWSTHISYACLLAENFTREGLLDAIRKRHTYGATDNIVLDFRARSGKATYIMGDSFAADAAPQLSVHTIGTGAIKQIDVVKNQKFVYTARPGVKEASFDYTDQDFGAGENYYYVRVLQEDGQIAWSSPVWVKSDAKPAVVR
jgi:hypothetical protein